MPPRPPGLRRAVQNTQQLLRRSPSSPASCAGLRRRSWPYSCRATATCQRPRRGRPAKILPVPRLLESAALQLRVAKRLAPRRGASLGERLGRFDDRLVFVVGSPRSGTTFLAGAIGSLPGFVDLGEVAPVKAAIPELASLEPAEAARRLRRTL